MPVALPAAERLGAVEVAAHPAPSRARALLPMASGTPSAPVRSSASGGHGEQTADRPSEGGKARLLCGQQAMGGEAARRGRGRQGPEGVNARPGGRVCGVRAGPRGRGWARVRSQGARPQQVLGWNGV